MLAIIDHLKKEIALYKEFIPVLQSETENLIGRDYKGLYETVSQKEHLIVQLDSMGRQRQRLLRDAAEALGIKGEVNLSAIIEKAGYPDNEELKRHQSMILSIFESVKEINKVNSLVVKGSLENIKKTLGFLGNFMHKANYKSSGAFEGIDLKGTRLSEGA